MKVYILMGTESFEFIYKKVYAATLDASLKERIMSDYEHDFPLRDFTWEEQELEEK